MKDTDFESLHYFGPHEFDSIGGHEHLHKNVVTLANDIRRAYGSPLRVTSAWRSSDGNSLVGGADISQHVLGRALDLVPISPSPSTFADLVMASLRFWCGGLGIYDDGHIHIDTRLGNFGARWVVSHGKHLAWTWDNLAEVVGRGRKRLAPPTGSHPG